MKALVFGTRTQPWTPPPGANALVRNLATTPCALLDVPDARPLRPDWLVVRPLLTGICGSDSKQILLDFDGDSDNAMSGLCSFPQVMGHEVVADVVALGPGGRGLRGRPAGGAQPVAVVRAPGASTRSARPARPGTTACAGASPTATSASASTPACQRRHRRLRRAHARPLDDAASRCPTRSTTSTPSSPTRSRCRCTASPATHRPRAAGSWCGAPASLGSCAVAILRALHPDVEVGVVARFDAQADLAAKLGAHPCSGSAGQLEMVEQLAAWSGGVLQAHDGGPRRHPHVPPRRHRRGLRHGRQARDLRGRGARAQGPGHAREERRARTRPLGVEPALLQGDQLGRLERLRHRGGRRRAPPRHRALPRPRRQRAASTSPACSPTPSG